MDVLHCHESVDIQEVLINSFTQRSGHNVFEMTVSKADGMDSSIIRRYSDFASFHRCLSLLYEDRNDIELPLLPTFKELFHTTNSSNNNNNNNDTSYHHIPVVDNLSKYCMTLLATLNSSMVERFFNQSRFDLELKRRKPLSRVHTKVEESDVLQKNASFPRFLVIADYTDYHFKVQAGEVVDVIGRDCEGWNMVVVTAENGCKYGWLPNSYLIWKEPGDSLVEDIQSYLLDQRHAQNEGSSVFSLTNLKSDSGSIDDLEINDSLFYECQLVNDSILYSVNGDEILLKKGTSVTLVDKDRYGWWFVSSSNYEGWLPSTVLEPKHCNNQFDITDRDRVYISSDLKRPLYYYVTQNYMACQGDELCFSAGEKIQVLHQSNSGWWTVRSLDESFTGIFPAVFLSNKPPNPSSSITSSSSLLPSSLTIGYNTCIAKTPPPRRTKIQKIPSILPKEVPLQAPPLNDHTHSKDLISIQSFPFSDRLEDRRPSLSAPSSPTQKLSPNWLYHSTDKEGQKQENKFTSPSRSNKRILVPHRKISENVLSYERSKSPIPLRFYRKTSSKDRPLIEEWAEPTKPTHSNSVEKSFFDSVAQCLNEEEKKERKEESENHNQLKKDNEEKSVHVHVVDKQLTSKQDIARNNKEHVLLKVEGKTDSEEEMMSSETRQKREENSNQKKENQQSEIETNEFLIPTSSGLLFNEDGEFSDDEVATPPPTLGRRRLSSLKKFPRLGNVKFSPGVNLKRISTDDNDNAEQDQRKGASLRRLGPQNSFFQKQRAVVNRERCENEEAQDEYSYTDNVLDKEYIDSGKEEDKEEEEEEISNSLYNKFFNKQSTTCGGVWHQTTQDEEENDENDKGSSKTGSRRGSLLSKQESFGGFSGTIESSEDITFSDPILDEHRPVPILDKQGPIPVLNEQRSVPILDEHRPIPIPDEQRFIPIPDEQRLVPDVSDKMMSQQYTNDAWSTSNNSSDEELIFTDNHFAIGSNSDSKEQVALPQIDDNNDDNILLNDAIDSVPSPPPPPPHSNVHSQSLISHFPVGYTLTLSNEYLTSSNYSPSLPVRSLSLSPVHHNDSTYKHTPNYEYTSTDHTHSLNSHEYQQRPSSAMGFAPLSHSNCYHDNPRPSSAASMSHSNRFHGSLEQSGLTEQSHMSHRSSESLSWQPKDPAPNLLSSGFLSFHQKTSNKLLHEQQHQAPQ